MKERIRKPIHSAAAVLLAVLLLALSGAGCSPKFDASGYVKAVLDNLYLDQSADYMEMVDVTADEAHSAYLDGLQTEAQVFYTYMSFDEAGMNDETEARVKALYGRIYSKARYEVEEAEKTREGYTVLVRIYPIDIFEQSMEDLNAYVEEFYGKIQAGDYMDMDEVQLNGLYQDRVLTILEGKTEGIGYLEPVEQVVAVEKDEEGRWGMSDEDFQNIDTYIIGY